MARPTALKVDRLCAQIFQVLKTRPPAKPGCHKNEREMPCISTWKNMILKKRFVTRRNGKPLLKQGYLQEACSLLCSLHTSWHSSLKNPVVLLLASG